MLPSTQHMSFDCFLCLRWFKSLSRLVLPTKQQTQATFLLVSYPSVNNLSSVDESIKREVSDAQHTSNDTESQQLSHECPLGRRKGNWTIHTWVTRQSFSLGLISKLTQTVFHKGKDNTSRKAQRPWGSGKCRPFWYRHTLVSVSCTAAKHIWLRDLEFFGT